MVKLTKEADTVFHLALAYDLHGLLFYNKVAGNLW